jgi:double-stranded uracil-DNA glycosylase
MTTDYLGGGALRAMEKKLRLLSTDKRLRDRIRPGVGVLFVGINPGIRSALTGHHFAGFSNRFWKLLYESGLVPAPITYKDDTRLPAWGYGITNIVPRATAGIDGLRPHEFEAGAAVLLRKIRRYRPAIVAVVGVTVWRALLDAWGDRLAKSRSIALGAQHPERIVAPGFAAALPPGILFFVLPNPSGRNANYSYEEMLAAYRALRGASRRLEIARLKNGEIAKSKMAKRKT